MADVEHNGQLVEALAEAVPSLPVRPGVRKLFVRSWTKANFNDETLAHVGVPLSLAKPSDLKLQLEAYGGAKCLLISEAQASISSRMADLRADQVLSQLAVALTSIMQRYRRGGLAVNLSLVTRGLATISVSSFVSRHHGFRRDLAAILHCGPADGAGLLKRYRAAILSGDSPTVETVDRRITSDEVWGPWADVFMSEGARLVEPPRPVTRWEFPTLSMSEGNMDGIRRWLFRRR